MAENSSDQNDDNGDNDADDIQIAEYEITSSPNDFNVATLYNYIHRNTIKIPGFQRNFVWDRVRASKLIESLMLNLPVPQIFLYEQARNRFFVIDGQQRLMSIYYFIKGRFPKIERRVELRAIFDREGTISEETFENDDFFEDFELKFTKNLPGKENKFSGLDYESLGDLRERLDFRTIRAVVISPTPEGRRNNNTTMFEVFNRLNTGGVNLRPQEIRTSMYSSEFYEMLYRINQDVRWRELFNSKECDLHMRDIEVLLRGFAMLVDGDGYAPSMIRFLNKFSNDWQTNSDKTKTKEMQGYLERLFGSFLSACQQLPKDVFLNKRTQRFNVALYEAVFYASCIAAFSQNQELVSKIDPQSVAALAGDSEFVEAASKSTTSTLNVKIRLQRAKDLIILV
ncbi:DUF262 domain-containing protein [uncultured Gammaproteobacteria bacterium]